MAVGGMVGALDEAGTGFIAMCRETAAGAWLPVGCYGRIRNRRKFCMIWRPFSVRMLSG